MSERKRESAWSRLRRLPEIFGEADLVSDGMSPNGLYGKVARWRQNDLVAPVGGRSGLYYNLVRLNCVGDPGAARDALGPKALAWLYPSATLIGPQALVQGGWIDTGRFNLAWRKGRSIPHYAVAAQRVRSINGARLCPRPAQWYATVVSQRWDTALGAALDPAWAYADALLFNDVGNLSADEIEDAFKAQATDELDRDREEAMTEAGRAIAALGPLRDAATVENAREKYEEMCDEMDVEPAELDATAPTP